MCCRWGDVPIGTKKKFLAVDREIHFVTELGWHSQVSRQRVIPGRYLWRRRTDETQLLFPLFDLASGCLHHLFDLWKENWMVIFFMLYQKEIKGHQHLFHTH